MLFLDFQTWHNQGRERGQQAEGMQQGNHGQKERRPPQEPSESAGSTKTVPKWASVLLVTRVGGVGCDRRDTADIHGTGQRGCWVPWCAQATVYCSTTWSLSSGFRELPRGDSEPSVSASPGTRGFVSCGHQTNISDFQFHVADLDQARLPLLVIQGKPPLRAPAEVGNRGSQTAPRTLR